MGLSRKQIEDMCATNSDQVVMCIQIMEARIEALERQIKIADDTHDANKHLRRELEKLQEKYVTEANLAGDLLNKVAMRDTKILQLEEDFKKRDECYYALTRKVSSLEQEYRERFPNTAVLSSMGLTYIKSVVDYLDSMLKSVLKTERK